MTATNTSNFTPEHATHADPSDPRDAPDVVQEQAEQAEQVEPQNIERVEQAPPAAPKPVITPGIQPTQIKRPETPRPQANHDQPDNDPPRIIALMNQKGGVGKTTTCTNLGAALARMGKRVLMIDLDPQAHLSLSLGVDPDEIELSMYDLLTDQNTSALEVLQQVGDDGRLTILPAEVNLAGVEAELADRVVTGMAQTVLKQKVAGLIKGLSGNPGSNGSPTTAPDFVLIDCPPSLGLLTVNALTLATEVIVPMQAHFLALQGLGKLFETISMMKQGINPNLKVAGVVLCMHEGNTILANEVINDVNGFLESARDTDAPWADAVVYHPPIRRNIKLAEAPSFGQSIFDYAADCHGAQDYAKLAESVIGQRVATN
ncbi:MAG: AAA family ATPase [Phycisphaerales bacterium]